MYCPICGTDWTKDMTTCPRCGKMVDVAAAGRSLPLLKGWWLWGLALVLLAAAVWFGWGRRNRPLSGALRYSYVEGVGWRAGTDTVLDEAQYKANCADPLPVALYAEDSAAYQGVLYKVVGYVEEDGAANPETDPVLHVMRFGDIYGNRWNARYVDRSETGYPAGTELILYGEFSGVQAGEPGLDVKYIESRDG